MSKIPYSKDKNFSNDEKEFDVELINDINWCKTYIEQLNTRLGQIIDHLFVISSDIFTKEGFYKKQISSLSEQLTLSQNMNEKMEGELKDIVRSNTELKRQQEEKINSFQRQLAENRESLVSFQQSEGFYKNLNKMQEQVITDMITLMKRSISDVSLGFISKAQENLEYLKNPLSMLDQATGKGAKGDLIDTVGLMQSIIDGDMN